ncbi:conserved hypothetical protein [Bacteroides sp. 1_1_14]|nr:conserved hypothetical protein [Bacteroides sp. 1_1_14]
MHKGKDGGNTGKVKKMRKGNQNGNPKKKKRWRKREKRGWSKRKHQITDIFCYIKHRVNNGDWIQ